VSQGLHAPVLVLNRSYLPIRVTTARQAFEMLFMGRAFALDGEYEHHDFETWMARRPAESEETIGTTHGPIAVPRLVLLATIKRVPAAQVRLSRRNVFLRDGHTCQYCDQRLPARDLNLDHVIPRSRGGTSTWENLVTSCRECNLRKGRHLPAECGMHPRRLPVRPRWSAVLHLVAGNRCYEEWQPFLRAS
jgi:5-methylcytosine-specific restriction endonuclease McrA